MSFSRGVLAVVFVLVATAVVGCGRASATSAGPSGPANSGVYEVRGVVVALDPARRILELDHEPIPGLMPAMTMPYEVADVALLQGLARGDRVKGTLRVDRSGYVITALQKV